MPPKSAEKSTDDGIKALIYLITSAKEFQADVPAVGALLGLAGGGKNVPRKINSFINPFGYEMKAGKIVGTGDHEGGGHAGLNNGDAEDDDADAATAATPKPKKPRKTDGVKTPAPKKGNGDKKRKLPTPTAEEDEAIDAAGHVVKAEEAEAVKEEDADEDMNQVG